MYPSQVGPENSKSYLATSEQPQTDLGGIWWQRGLHSVGAPRHWVSIIGHVYSKQPLFPRDEFGCAAFSASHWCYQAWHHLPRRAQDRHIQLPLASCPVGVNGKFLVLPNLNSWRKGEKLEWGDDPCQQQVKKESEVKMVHWTRCFYNELLQWVAADSEVQKQD